jgi:hypothetical protein
VYYLIEGLSIVDQIAILAWVDNGWRDESVT